MVYENYYSFCEYTQCQWLAFISQITQNSNKKKKKKALLQFSKEVVDVFLHAGNRLSS